MQVKDVTTEDFLAFETADANEYAFVTQKGEKVDAAEEKRERAA